MVRDAQQKWYSRTVASGRVALALAVALPAAPALADPLLDGGKLILTNGITSLEGASGGGLASWATIAGLETNRGVGVSAHVTGIDLADFGWQSHGISIGIKDRVEISFARQNFDTRKVGAALGLGQGYKVQPGHSCSKTSPGWRHSIRLAIPATDQLGRAAQA